MRTYLQFESSLKDDWSCSDKGDFRAPAGLEHSKLLVAHLPSTMPLIDGPWNEEDYAWGFLTKFNGFNVSVLVGERTPVETWLVIVNTVVFFGFLRRRRVLLAVSTVTDAIESILRADARIKNVQRFSEAQFDALDA
jgi:hypothetical protein